MKLHDILNGPVTFQLIVNGRGRVVECGLSSPHVIYESGSLNLSGHTKTSEKRVVIHDEVKDRR